MLLGVLAAAVSLKELGVRAWTYIAALVLHVELLLLLGLLDFLHQVTQELVVSRCLGNIGRASRGAVELLRVKGPGVARVAGEFREMAAETGATCGADLDRVSGLM